MDNFYYVEELLVNDETAIKPPRVPSTCNWISICPCGMRQPLQILVSNWSKNHFQMYMKLKFYSKTFGISRRRDSPHSGEIAAGRTGLSVEIFVSFCPCYRLVIRCQLPNSWCWFLLCSTRIHDGNNQESLPGCGIFPQEIEQMQDLQRVPSCRRIDRYWTGCLWHYQSVTETDPRFSYCTTLHLPRRRGLGSIV